jgi:hypothetical protein
MGSGKGEEYVICECVMAMAEREGTYRFKALGFGREFDRVGSSGSWAGRSCGAWYHSRWILFSCKKRKPTGYLNTRKQKEIKPTKNVTTTAE